MIKLKKATNIISIVLILCYIIFLIIGWKNFPDEIPTHFNAAGVADEFGSKSALFIEPAAMIGLFLLLAIVECFPRIWNIPIEVTEENAEDVERIIHNMFGVIKIAIVLICAYSGFMCINTGFPSWPIWLMAAIILLSLSFSIYRLYKCR